jgi:hypothetical protein
MSSPARTASPMTPQAREALREIVRALARQQAEADYRARKAAQEQQACAR